MGKPGVWDDQQRAASVSSEHRRAARKLESYRALKADVEDLSGLAELAAEDGSMVAELEEQLVDAERRMDALEEQRLFQGRYDSGDAAVSVHSGAGGTDSQDWAEMLLRMYLRWAQRRGFDVEMAEASEGEEAGIKSATFLARGENAYGLFSAEKGVHRLVRISPFDAAARRHTSFAQVEIAPLVEEDVAVEIDDDDLRIDTYRAQGAGGQHVNKTDSAVRLTHLPTNIVVQSQNERSQVQNKENATKVLKARLLERALEEKEAEIRKLKGEHVEAGWGNQIRSYVLHPYQMVKDLRTGHETGNTTAVLDGDLDAFMQAELERLATGGEWRGDDTGDAA